MWCVAAGRRYGAFLCVVSLWLAGGRLCADQSSDDATAATRDTLVYKDGDRVLGKFLERAGDTIVFKSDRFGELRVPSADAVVVPAEKLAAKPAPPRTSAAPGATQEQVNRKEEEEKVSLWERFSPFMLTAKVRRYFGPWHGKFGFTAESVSDTSDRDNTDVNARLQRKWERDEVQFNARYTYSQTNALTTTDLVKADGLWRHDYPSKKYFFAYRPTLEWNRAYLKDSLPADYLLVQQEIGFGVNLYNTPAYQVRTGLSENIFTNWVLATDNHLTKNVESAFLEVDAKLPWRMSISDRTVYYYSLKSSLDGFENKIELDKKFTETLSIGLRYEVRYNNPDVRSADYNLLRLVMGFDF